MYQFTLLHVPEDGNPQGRRALQLPIQTHQSASDNDPAKLGTVSISNSSRVSEVHGDHTLAPSGHATKPTWMQSTHYTCFVRQAICNSVHHTRVRSVGICAFGQLIIHALTTIHRGSPLVQLCNNIIIGGSVSVCITLDYCNYCLLSHTIKTLIQ